MYSDSFLTLDLSEYWLAITKSSAVIYRDSMYHYRVPIATFCPNKRQSDKKTKVSSVTCSDNPLAALAAPVDENPYYFQNPTETDLI